MNEKVSKERIMTSPSEDMETERKHMQEKNVQQRVLVRKIRFS